MKILVTGGAGFIGSKVVNSLIRNGHSVSVFDNFSNGRIRNMQADTLEIDTVTFKPTKLDVDCIIHMAARTCIRECINDPHLTLNVNVTGTQNMLETAKLSNAHFIFISSSVAEHPYMNVYGLSKAIGEELCYVYHTIYDVPLLILRPCNVYGRDSRTSVISIFQRLTKENKELSITGDGSQSYDYVHVDDVVDGICKSAEKQDKIGKTIHLGTGITHSIKALAEMFQPGRERVWLPRVIGELASSKADLQNCTYIGWEAKISIKQYIKEFLEEMGSNHLTE